MSETSIPRIDLPEAYAGDSTVEYGRIENGNEFLNRSQIYSPEQHAQVALEAGMFGIDPAANPDQFIQTHNALLSDLQEEFNTDLDATKQQIIERTAQYFAGGDEQTQQGMIDLLSARLADTTRLKVSDNLIVHSNSSGTFDMHRQPVVTSKALIETLHASQDTNKFRDTINKVVVAHELMHGMLTTGEQETRIIGNYTIRNGVQVTDVENPREKNEVKRKYATWVNEATLENFRQTIMETEDVRYEPGVMVIRMLDELSPGLQDDLVIAALDSGGPGPVFGKIENLLGPTAIDDVEEMLADVTNLADLETFKDAVAALLPRDMQEKGRVILEEKQAEIFGWQPDYEENRRKQLEEAASRIS